MLKSMFAAISGLKSHQTMMDVTANNIANVNTIGYKSSRATFASALSQTIHGASGPTAAGRGGVNPAQVGIGVTVSGIQTNFSAGSPQDTGQWTDMKIDGDGMFIVTDQLPTAGTTPANVQFTRAGNFSRDQNGNLVTQSGQYLLGNTVNNVGPPVAYNDDLGLMNVPTSATSVNIGSDGAVTYLDSTGAMQTVGRVALANFPNPAGLSKVGDNLYAATANSGAFNPNDSNNTATPPTPGVVSWGGAGSNGRGVIVDNEVEMSNVDLAQEFTNMITAQRGFSANSRVISASDEMLQDLVNMKH